MRKAAEVWQPWCWRCRRCQPRLAAGIRRSTLKLSISSRFHPNIAIARGLTSRITRVRVDDEHRAGDALENGSLVAVGKHGTPFSGWRSEGKTGRGVESRLGTRKVFPAGYLLDASMSIDNFVLCCIDNIVLADSLGVGAPLLDHSMNRTLAGP